MNLSLHPVRWLIWMATWGKQRAFQRDLRRPEEAQARVWREIRAEIADAPFWKGRLPERLEDLDLTDYEHYRAAIDRSFQGSVSELSGRPVVYWAESSGTTGVRKIFPLTAHYRAQFQATTPPLLREWITKYPGFLANPVVYLAGMNPAERSPAGIDVGFISNFNYRHIPGFLRSHYALPQAVFKDWDTFSRWAPAYALATDLSAIIGISPSVPTSFLTRIDEEREFLLACLEGREVPPAPLPPIRCAPERLATVRSALAPGRPLRAQELWPGLAFVCCWQSSSCSLQVPALARYLDGEVPLHDATYSASEGWMNVPMAGGVGGPLHPGAHVFEFLPVGAEARRENLLPLWRLEAGEDYEIVISNSMGLLRYRLYDVVRCTGHMERTPIVAFLQKAVSEICLGHMRVSETQICEAVAATGFEPPTSWFFAPSSDGAALEVVCGSTARVAEDALLQIDRALVAKNKYYARDRGRGMLEPIRLRELPADHPAWQRPTHAQSKPVILRRDPIPA